MSIVDVPYYSQPQGSQGSPAAYSAMLHNPHRHYLGLSEAMCGPILDHRLANMGLDDGGSDDDYESPFAAPTAASTSGEQDYDTALDNATLGVYEMGMPPFPHMAEARHALVLDHHHSLTRDAEVSPFGATLRQEGEAYIVEAPTPGIPKERLVLEAIGLRRLELTIAPSSASSDEATEEMGEALEKESETGEPITPKRAPAPASRRERDAAVAAAFRRGVTLPSDCDLSSASCTYENGVLRVVVPRAPVSSLVPGHGAIGAAHADLLAEATEVKKRVAEARSELRSLEQAAKEAGARLKSALSASRRSGDRVALAI